MQKSSDLQSLIIQERDLYLLSYFDTLDVKKGSRILDLGGGRGVTSEDLFQRGYSVVGFDTSEAVFDSACENTKIGLEGNTPFFSERRGQSDYPNDSFDAVIAVGLLEYLRWDRWALQEMFRVLKPGGYLILSVPNRMRLSYITDPFFLISSVLQRKGKYISRVSETSCVPNRNFYVPSSLKHLIIHLDFTIIDSISHGFGPFFLFRRFNRVSIKINQLLNRWSERNRLPFLSESGSEYSVLCQKREKSPDFSRRHIFSDIDNHLKLFESEKKEFFARRNVWLKKNPEYSHPEIRQFNTQAYSGENVLVLSPHPDDEIIGCGGTLIKLHKEGSKVSVIQLTDGSDSSALRDCPEHIRKTIRLDEARVVAENLGFAELILFNEVDSRLKCTRDTVAKLSALLNRLDPKVIFVPFINDIHPDHIAANEILSKSLESSLLNLSEVNVLSYEVWNFVPPNSLCIIDNQFDKKAEILMKYRTGMKVIDYIHFCESLNAYHAYKLLGKKGFAEVFLAIDAKRYVELIQGRK
jgi:LmbE family N-acetylglucosaminyl deacetylase/SAM-dependent methyltransferase